MEKTYVKAKFPYLVKYHFPGESLDTEHCYTKMADEEFEIPVVNINDMSVAFITEYPEGQEMKTSDEKLKKYIHETCLYDGNLYAPFRMNEKHLDYHPDYSLLTKIEFKTV